MKPNELLELKSRNLQMALNRQEGDYVPSIMVNETAGLARLGKRAVDLMLGDPAEYVTAQIALFSEMWMDGSLLCGVPFSPLAQKAFPTCENIFGPDGNTPEHVQLAPMQKDEYDQLIADPMKFIADVLLPRKFPDLFTDREGARASLKMYAQDRGLTLKLMGMTNMALAEHHGIVSLANKAERFEVPLDMLFDYFRGFRGTLTDLRRQPDKVRAAIDALWEVRCAPKMAVPMAEPQLWAVDMCHIPAYLSPKQYEELYWPHFKLLLERIAKAGGKAYINMEGRWSKVWYHFKDLPKDCCILQVDDDDLFELYAELGQDQIITGGVKIADTRLKPFEVIKDDIKRVIDTCAPGGGFLLDSDKGWIAPGDVNQTLIEVFNFAHEYSKK